MERTIGLIAGRGTGWELIEAVRCCIQAVGDAQGIAFDLVAFDDAAWCAPIEEEANHTDYSDGGLLVADHPEIRMVGAHMDSSADAAIIAELSPEATDVVITKTRYDPFVGTMLEQELIGRGVGRLMVAGLPTNVCVEATVRGAYDRGVRAVVLRDGVASYSENLHEASLETLARHHALVCDFAALPLTLQSV